MKWNTLARYRHTVDYYEPTLVAGTGQNEGTLVFPNEPTRTLKCRINSDGSGRLYMYVQEPIRLGSRVTNIRDREGNLLIEGTVSLTGYGYDVTGINPVQNAMGVKTETRYTLLRVAGNLNGTTQSDG